jgi:hypothetical protein
METISFQGTSLESIFVVEKLSLDGDAGGSPAKGFVMHKTQAWQTIA